MISAHLSTRSDCKDVNYHVTITENTISFEPDVKVFPNTHNRKPTDKMSILEHILRYHIDSLVPEDKEEMRDSQGRYYITRCKITNCKLFPGTYVYRSSIDGKRRKWFRE